MKGCDFSYWRPGGAWLRENGFTFVCRYLSHDPSKNLGAAEYADYKANGIAVVLNFEDGAQNMLGGYAQGVADANVAVAEARSLGLWPNPIYYSADFDASVAQQSAINAYLQGCASVMGAQWVGMYGGYYALSRAFDAGVVTFGWGTYAWSNNQWELRSHIRQVPGGSGNYDLDEAMVPEFGQVGDPIGGFLMALTDAEQAQLLAQTSAIYAWLSGTGNTEAALVKAIYDWAAGSGNAIEAAVQPAAIAAAVKSAGLVGEPGPAGPQGPAGPAGANGTSDSALLVTGMQAAIAAVEGAK